MLDDLKPIESLIGNNDVYSCVAQLIQHDVPFYVTSGYLAENAYSATMDKLYVSHFCHAYDVVFLKEVLKSKAIDFANFKGLPFCELQINQFDKEGVRQPNIVLWEKTAQIIQSTVTMPIEVKQAIADILSEEFKQPKQSFSYGELSDAEKSQVNTMLSIIKNRKSWEIHNTQIKSSNSPLPMPTWLLSRQDNESVVIPFYALYASAKKYREASAIKSDGKKKSRKDVNRFDDAVKEIIQLYDDGLLDITTPIIEDTKKEFKEKLGKIDPKFYAYDMKRLLALLLKKTGWSFKKGRRPKS